MPICVDMWPSTSLFHFIPSFYFRQRGPYRRNKDHTRRQRISTKHRKHTNTHHHIYTTRSDFTRALLLALQRAASDFLELIIRVSKLGKLAGADPWILEREGGKNRAPKASPRKFWKIRCDFLQSGIYFLDQNGVGYQSKLGLCRTKNSSGHDFETHQY